MKGRNAEAGHENTKLAKTTNFFIFRVFSCLSWLKKSGTRKHESYETHERIRAFSFMLRLCISSKSFFIKKLRCISRSHAPRGNAARTLRVRERAAGHSHAERGNEVNCVTRKKN
jgi:hypothetical protein